MKLLTLLILAGLGLAAAAVVPPAAATPEAPQDEDPPVADDPRDELAKRVEELEAANAALKERVDAHEQLIAKAYGWMKTLPGAGDALESKVEQAREDGFEAAGPNPRSKKAVLDGLLGLAAALRANNPAAPTTDEEPKNRRNR